MLNITPPKWAVPERQATPEHVFLNRRQWLAGVTALTGLSAMPALAAPEDPWTPKPNTNPAFADPGRPVTPEDVNSRYNNFYEFGSHKNIWRAAQDLPTDPWNILIDGMVEEPFEIGFEDLMKKVSVEERVYRHRCVEAWSMVVPWIGFPLKDLVALAKPLSSAKYLRFETFMNPDVARGQREHWQPWPYVEGVTIEEAANDLSFMATGAYGKELHKQFGAPIRLHLPWKYGFKSIKSVVRISFTDQQPVSFWEQLQNREYGFWANVNPEVSHPRWSQAQERVLGTEEKIPTLLFNGYGEQVASLYSGIDAGDRLWR